MSELSRAYKANHSCAMIKSLVNKNRKGVIWTSFFDGMR